MTVKIKIQDHVLASDREKSEAEFQASALADQLKFEGKANISTVKVLFTPNGKIGGCLVTRSNNDEKDSEIVKEAPISKSKRRKRDSCKENANPTGDFSTKMDKSKEKKSKKSRRSSGLDDVEREPFRLKLKIKI